MKADSAAMKVIAELEQRLCLEARGLLPNGTTQRWISTQSDQALDVIQDYSQISRETTLALARDNRMPRVH